MKNNQVIQSFLFTLLLFGFGSGIIKAQNLEYLVGPVLFNQIDHPSASSQNSTIYYNVLTGADTLYGTSFGTSSVVLADDFTVPTGKTWDVYSVIALGNSISSESFIHNVSLTIYNNVSKKPGAIVANYSSIANYYLIDGDFLLYLPNKLTLSQGTYWISVAVSSDNIKYYRWKWQYYNVYDTMGIAPTNYKFLSAQNNTTWSSMIDKYSYHNTDLAFALYGAYSNDLAIISTKEPVSGTELSNENITIQIGNIGSLPQTGFKVKYKVDDQTEVVEKITSTLNPGEIMDYTFTTLADISAIGTHQIWISVNLTTDEYTTNDTDISEVTNYGIIYPISDYNGQSLKVCEGSFTDAGGLTGGTKRDTAMVTFLPSDNTKRAQLEFSSFNLAYSDTLYIYDGANVQAPIIGKWYADLNPGTVVSTSGDGNLTVEFKGQSVNSEAGWIASISCIDAPANDLALVEISVPSTGIELSANEVVTLQFKNIGLTPISTFQASYTYAAVNQASNTIVETVNLTTPVEAGDFFNYTFTQQADLSTPQIYHFSAEAILIDDENAANDTISKSLENLGKVFSISDYCNDTIKTCGGTFTDDGGIFGDVAPERMYSCVLKSGDPLQRIKLNFIDFSVGYDGILTIYNGIDNTAPKIGEFGYSQLLGEIVSQNQYGALYVEFTSGLSSQSGWRAEISCYAPFENDFCIKSISVKNDPGALNKANAVSAVIQNLGSLKQKKDAIFSINNIDMDTLASKVLIGGEFDTVVFNWNPLLEGINMIKVRFASDDDNGNNIDSMSVQVYAKLALNESFEGEIFPPNLWTAGSSWSRVKPAQFPAKDGLYTAAKAGHNPFTDTLCTPLLNIKNGDVVKLKIMSMGGWIIFGYFDDQNIYHRIPFDKELVYGQYYDINIDVSAAAGHRRFVIVAEPGMYIDKISGPEYYFEDNDVAISKIIAEPTAVMGDSIEIKAVVQNFGGSALSGDSYSIKLFRKGNPDFELNTYNGIDIGVAQLDTIILKYAFSYAGAQNIYATVNLKGDLNTANNTSNVLPIDVYYEGAVSINLGTDTIPDLKLPMSLASNYSVSQVMYHSEQIGSVGKVAGMSYDYSFFNDQSDVHTKIYMGETTQTDLLTGWVSTNDMQLVFDGSLTFSGGVNTLYMPFENPYLYKGGNLVVMVYKYSPDSYQSQKFYKSATDFVSAKVVTSSSDIDLQNLPEGTTSSFIPKTTLYINSNIGTVTGKVLSNLGEPLTNATIKIEGCKNYNAISAADGSFKLSNVVLNQNYTVTVSAANFEKQILKNVYFNQVNFDLGDIKLPFIEIPYSIIAEPYNNIYSIKWQHETTATFLDPVYINSSLEEVFAAPADTNLYAGNLIPVKNPGTIIGVYVWAVATDIYIGNKAVTVEMLDKTFKTMAVSKPFHLPDNMEILVDLPYTSYNDDFYLMIHWDNLDETTYSIGLDTDGDYQLGYVGNRKNGFKSMGGTFSVMPAMLSNLNRKNTRAFKGYDLYRGLQSEMDSVVNWEKVNNIPIVPVNNKVTYFDYSWPPANPESYMYAVQSVYENAYSNFVYSNLVKYQLEYNVTFKVKTNGGAAKGAVISLVNQDEMAIHKYDVKVDAQGLAKLPVVERGKYSIELKSANYEPYFAENILISHDFDTLDIELTEIINAPFNVKAVTDNHLGKAMITWNGYSDTTQMILDDGSYENGIWINADAKARLGNKFNTNLKGKIISVDVYGLQSGLGDELPVTIDVYDDAQNHISSSNPFTIPANEFRTVTFNAPVNFDGNFYVMVYWNMVGGATNMLPLDLNGSNKGKLLAYIQSDEDGFYPLGMIQSGLDGVFAIRPNVFIEGMSTKALVQPKRSLTPAYEFNNLMEVANFTNAVMFAPTRGFGSFNVYLNNMSVPYAQNVTNLFYELTDLPAGSYRVGISSVYSSGESEIVITDFMMHTAVDEHICWYGNIFPNPTTGIVYFNNSNVKYVSIYDLSGKLIDTKIPSSLNNAIDMSNIENGTYLLKFQNNEQSEVIKIVVNK